MPVTGVISIHNVDIEWGLIDEICLGCEAMFQDIEEDENLSEDEKVKEFENAECFDHEKLIGDWKKNKQDLWTVDENGEYGFSAIVTDSTFNCIQVIWSRWTTNVRSYCSPCFPGQADLDSGAGDIIAYTLPDEYLNQEFIDVEKED